MIFGIADADSNDGVKKATVTEIDNNTSANPPTTDAQ